MWQYASCLALHYLHTYWGKLHLCMLLLHPDGSILFPFTFWGKLHFIFIPFTRIFFNNNMSAPTVLPSAPPLYKPTRQASFHRTSAVCRVLAKLVYYIFHFIVTICHENCPCSEHPSIGKMVSIPDKNMQIQTTVHVWLSEEPWWFWPGRCALQTAIHLKCVSSLSVLTD